MYIYSSRSVISENDLNLAGPSGTGKTEIARNIVAEAPTIFDRAPKEIIYCFGAWQKAYEDMPNVSRFHEGLVDYAELPNDQEHRLLVLDDVAEEAGNSQAVCDLFVKFSHHRNISVVLITQNVFAKSRFFRTLSLNTQLFFLTNNVRDRTQIATLARQIFPRNSKYLLQAFDHAMKSQVYGHLMIDLHVASDDRYRLRGNIFTEPIVYVQ